MISAGMSLPRPRVKFHHYIVLDSDRGIQKPQETADSTPLLKARSDSTHGICEKACIGWSFRPLHATKELLGETAGTDSPQLIDLSKPHVPLIRSCCRLEER